MRYVAALIVLSVVSGAHPAAANPAATAHDLSFSAIDGAPLPLASFAGKAVLIVNTASFCGYTHQYADLQKLWRRYRDRGLVVLGVPSNDFGAQEPGSSTEIKQFCEVNFDVDFPLTEKQVCQRRARPPVLPMGAPATGQQHSAAMEFPQISGGAGRSIDRLVRDPGGAVIEPGYRGDRSRPAGAELASTSSRVFCTTSPATHSAPTPNRIHPAAAQPDFGRGAIELGCPGHRQPSRNSAAIVVMLTLSKAC